MKQTGKTPETGRGGLIRFLTLLGLVGIQIVGSIVYAQSPPVALSYQGYISDLTNNSVGLTGDHNIELWIFASQDETDDANALWAEQFSAVPFSDGIFSVILGTSASVNTTTYPGPTSTDDVGNDLAAVFSGVTPSDQDRFLEIRVDNGSDFEAINTRLRFLSSPFAFLATQAANAATADFATTADSLSGDKLSYSDSNSRFDVNGGLDVTGNATLASAAVTGTASFGDTITTQKVRIQATEDADTQPNGALLIGDTSGSYLSIDGNEIQANNAPEWEEANPNFTMYINRQGGKLEVGGPLTLSEWDSGHAALSSSRSGQPRTTSRQLIFQTAEGSEWIIGMERGTDDVDDDELFFTYHNGGGEAGADYKATRFLDPSTGWEENSDRRIKKAIEPIEDGILDRMMGMPPVRYRFKMDSDDSVKQYGFIAQDVQKVFPDLVDSEKGRLALPYSRFGVLAVAAIRELKQESDERVSELSERIESLQSDNSRLLAERENLAKQLDAVFERLAALESNVQ